MKTKNIKLFLYASSLFFATSCTDLNVDIKSQYTSFPNSEDAAEAVAANIYNYYREALGGDHWMVQTLSSDEAVSVALGSDYYDGGIYMQLDLHSWRSDLSKLSTIWNSAMKGVTGCNQVLQILGDTESTGAAPVRAMRAFYYFILMDNFGNVPIQKSISDTPSDRSPRKDVCEFIESELLAVRDKLTTTVDETTYGKATRYMADALLVKLYLNWNVYTASDVTSYTPGTINPKLNNAIAICDEIINSGKFNLKDDFFVKFRPTNGSQIKDFIFAMPFDREKQQGMTYARFWTHRSAQKGFYEVDLPNSVAGTFRCLPEFYDKFNLPNDERNKQYLTGKLFKRKNFEATTEPFTISTSKKGIDQDYTGGDADTKFNWQVELTKDIVLRPDGAETLNCGNDQKGRSMGYRSIKFYMDIETTKAQNRSQSNDVPIFRYADILLMKAEAILRGASATNNDTPASLMNQIRSCVGAPSVSGTPTLDELLDERAREFADESWRRNDLIRFGKFENPWGFKYLFPGNTDKNRRIFPVPQDVMNTNTNWTQNAGY